MGHIRRGNGGLETTTGGDKMNANQQALEALIEASNLFDNYPQLYEMIGTYQVVQDAINRLMKEVTA